MKEYDLVIIGGGPAGLSAAISAKEQGINKIIIIEREKSLGGALNEYIHNGFGIKKFGYNTTGPEYIERYVEKINELEIEYIVNSTALSLSDKQVTVVNEEGIQNIKFQAIILAMGCREQARNVKSIPRTRCSGVYTCGAAHKFMNLEGFLPGKNIVIFGGNKLSLLTARRLKLEGADVKIIIDEKSKAEGNKDIINECLNDFNIPFKHQYSIVAIKGKERIEGITIEKNNEDKNTRSNIECDTLLLSVDVSPETSILEDDYIDINKASNGIVVNSDMNTSKEGIFACGSIVKVHDYVDDVTNEGKLAGISAAKHILRHIEKINKSLNSSF